MHDVNYSLIAKKQAFIAWGRVMMRRSGVYWNGCTGYPRLHSTRSASPTRPRALPRRTIGRRRAAIRLTA